MNRIAVIGDEVSAAGFRLAGAEVHVPAAGEEAAVFERVYAGAELVLVTAPVAARLPRARLAQAAIAPSPLLLIVPDVRGRASPVDLSRLVRAQLGIEK
jgi:vacuolar-type H+-ATPase subunit F/Vma7